MAACGEHCGGEKMTSLSPQVSKLRAAGLAHGFKAEDDFEVFCLDSPRGVFDSGVLHFDEIAVESTC